MIKQVEDSFLLSEKKDKDGEFMMKSLVPKLRRTYESIPGINQPMLDGSVQVILGGGTGGGSKALSFTKSSGSGTGAVNLTGFGFQPSGYTIIAWKDDGSSETNMSFSSYIGGVISGYYVDTTLKNLSSRVVCVYESSSNCRANHSAFLSDGIQLNFISDTVGIKYIVTAYK